MAAKQSGGVDTNTILLVGGGVLAAGVVIWLFAGDGLFKGVGAAVEGVGEGAGKILGATGGIVEDVGGLVGDVVDVAGDVVKSTACCACFWCKCDCPLF